MSWIAKYSGVFLTILTQSTIKFRPNTVSFCAYHRVSGIFANFNIKLCAQEILVLYQFPDNFRKIEYN